MPDPGPVVANAGPLIVLAAVAKKAGFVTSVRPFLEQMLARGYFLAPAVVERALQEAGE